MEKADKSKKKNRCQYLLFFLCVLMGVVGCNFKNLYDFKKQLSDPDTNFDFVTSERYYSIKLNTPTLETDDIRDLLKMQPRYFVQSEEQVWHLNFFSEDQDKLRFRSSILLTFSRNRLSKIDFPLILEQFAPPSIFRQYLKVLGYSRIDPANNRSIVPDDLSLQALSFPSMARCVDLFGAPTSTENQSGEVRTTVLKYQMVIKGEGDGQRLPIFIELRFRRPLGAFDSGSIKIGPYIMLFTEAVVEFSG